MNAWHVYARYNNFGDYALGVGLRNVLDRHFKPGLIFKLYDAHEIVFDDWPVQQLNSTANMLLVGGGGLIHGTGGEWLFRMRNHVVDKVRVPMVFYGLGYNLFPNEPSIGQPIIDNLKLLQERAISFTVRNDGTRERLAGLGFEAPEVPDPGFFVDGDYRPPPIPKPFVLMQLAFAIPKWRDYAESDLIAQVGPVIRSLLKRGYQVVLAPHTLGDDRLAIRLQAELGSPLGLHKWNWHHIMRDECTFEGLAYYKHARFVIGMRGHSQICPIGMGTPVIVIENHAKHKGLIAKLGIADLSVSLADRNLAGTLIELIQEVENGHDAISEDYLAKMAVMNAFIEQFLQDLSLRVANYRMPEPPTVAPRLASPSPTPNGFKKWLHTPISAAKRWIRSL